MGSSTWALLLTLFLLPCLAAALTCDTYPQAELNEWKLAECSNGVASSTCFMMINETATGKAIDFIPETAFQLDENSTNLKSLYTDSNGVVAISWRIKPEIYYESNNYTATINCGNETSSITFTALGFGSNTQVAGSTAKYFQDNAGTCLIGFVCIGFGLFLLAFLLNHLKD